MANTHATSHDPRIGAPAAVREAQTATGPQRGAPPADKAQLAVRCIHTMRTLAMDAVQQANSGHPGPPMALAPVAFVLWDRHLRHNPANPQWPNRDRFMLSNGHASMLLYVLLYLTQHGNNNAYCQDNETRWYAWHDLERHQEIARFTRGLIAFRRAHPILSQEAFSTDAEVHWCSPHGVVPAWTDPHEQRVACQLHEDAHHGLYLMCNASTEAVDFLLPPAPEGARWHLAVGTVRAAPYDLCVAGDARPLDPQSPYHVSPRSSVILLARPADMTNMKDHTRSPDSTSCRAGWAGYSMEIPQCKRHTCSTTWARASGSTPSRATCWTAARSSATSTSCR